MTAPAILALVRHAESTWIAEGRFQGRGDPPLSGLGLRQATAVGARMAAPGSSPEVPVPDSVPQVIWHSPLRRAAQTAAAIREAREADAPMRQLEDITEVSQGEWEGLTHKQVSEQYATQLAAWRADPFNHHAPGGESLAEARERIRRALDVILERGTGEPGAHDEAVSPAEPVLGYERTIASRRRPWSVVVAHDGILRLLMLELMDIPIQRFWSFPFALAAVTVLDLTMDVARLRAHNLDEHVAALTR